MTPNEVTSKIVELLYQAKAGRWTIQQKGNLIGAVKLQLRPATQEKKPTQ